MTPDEWLSVLEKRLDVRRPQVDLYENYYAGRHRLSFVSSRFRETFGQLFSAFSDNWCALVVDASVERLAVEGFRFAAEQEADADAWAIWQANDMDAQSMLAHTEAVKCGEAYALISPGDDGPIITVEHPSQCIVACDPGMRRVRLAALKKWCDDDGYTYANVYMPDVVAHFRSAKKQKTGSSGKSTWESYDDDEHDAVEDHDLGEVPMVALLNEPGMLAGGASDLQLVIKPQDAINKLVADMLIASEAAAFPQRWATGIEPQADDEDTTAYMAKLKTWLSSAANVWTVGDSAAQFGQFQAADLGNYVKAVEMLVQHVAAQTRTPPHYLLGGSGAFPSGESLKATETGLVAKVRRKQLTFGDTWEASMRLAMRAAGKSPADGASAETLWRDPESRTTGEQTDAAVKELSVGIPKEMVWRRRLGMSPQEIEQARAMSEAEGVSPPSAPSAPPPAA